MTSILFERRPDVYLPEITAYQSYLTAHQPDVKTYDSVDDPQAKGQKHDIVWRFMGTDIAGQGDCIVHEYNSLSAPPLAGLKNRIKRMINQKPARRVFLNPLVRDDFGFQDDVPGHIRDMGVADAFFEAPRAAKKEPEFDCVYAGSLYRGTAAERMLAYFNTPEGQKISLLVVGDARQDTMDRYGAHGNITFTGRVPYADVPKHMLRARFGLNIMPLEYPFTMQTATKVLEYSALGLPVISPRYAWIERFMTDRGGRALYIGEGGEGLTLDTIEKYDFSVPKVDDLRWDTVIRESGIFDMLPKSNS